MMDTQQLLENTNLRYVSTDMAGYTRKPWGRGFTYQDKKGETIQDEKLRDWIESLVIPPAWTDVWISPYKNGHILATGRDDADRKQYIYHPQWNDLRGQTKFHNLAQFGKALPNLRDTVDAHLRKRKLSKEKVLAVVVRLLETTLIRIGNTHYAKQNDSYGLTTLRDKHAEIKKNTVTFEFTGKSGKEHEVMLEDKNLARAVKACRDIPGYELFQYYDEDGQRHSIDSSDVNAYIKDITGEDFTAKIFRTWGGSVLAIQVLCNDVPDDLEIDKHAKWCIECVADSLGNTVAVCRDYYVYPQIFEAYEAGKLCSLYEANLKKQDKLTLRPEEQTLIDLIQS